MKVRFGTKRFSVLATLCVLMGGWFFAGSGEPLHAQSPAPPNVTPNVTPDDTPSPASSEPTTKPDKTSSDGRKTRISNYLTGATFAGMFTMDGETATPKQESYTIVSCEPLEEEDQYRLKVKIRYGDVDGEFPMDLKILFSGSTPVITLDGVWIPGLGTFSSRVLIHQGRYAGTWQHDAKGGHLFGTVTPAKE